MCAFVHISVRESKREVLEPETALKAWERIGELVRDMMVQQETTAVEDDIFNLLSKVRPYSFPPMVPMRCDRDRFTFSLLRVQYEVEEVRTYGVFLGYTLQAFVRESDADGRGPGSSPSSPPRSELGEFRLAEPHR